MALSYLVDAPLSPDVGPQHVRDDLAGWLADQGALLKTGVFDNGRIHWAERVTDADGWQARLLAVNTAEATEVRALFRSSSGRLLLRLERQSLRAMGGDPRPLEPAPPFLSAWLAAGGQGETSPNRDETGAVVALSSSEPMTPAESILQAEIARHTAGMARLLTSTPDNLDSLANGVGLTCDGRPGSLLTVTQAAGVGRGHFLPATVAIRNPVAAARRVLQTLLSRCRLDVSTEWTELEEALAGSGLTNVDEALGELSRAESIWLAERSALVLQLQLSVVQADDLVVDRASDAEEIDVLRTQVRRLQRELARLNAYPVSEPRADELDLYPDSCVGAVEVARDALTNVLVTAEMGPVEKLDEQQRSLYWAKRLWTMLRGLNDYAELVNSGQFIGHGLADYCRNPPPGVVPLSWAKIAFQESEQTMNRPHCVKARTFRVPPGVDLSGVALMVPHLKVDNVPPAPRAHFIDATTQVGKVIVGYVGPHLPTE